MQFQHRKFLEKDSNRLRKIPVGKFLAGRLVFVPVYVFLRRNRKYVSIKEPLDSFSKEELERFEKSVEFFYLPKFSDLLEPSRRAGRAVQRILQWDIKAREETNETFPRVILPPSPYEKSDTVLRLIGPLWGDQLRLDPFFLAVLSDEICGEWDEGVLHEVRERNVARYELGLLRASLAVFLALHLGNTDLNYLRAVRSKVFGDGWRNLERSLSTPNALSEMEALSFLSLSLLREVDQRVIEGSVLKDHALQVAQKLSFRFKRVLREFVEEGKKAPSLVGAEGLFDG
jgi:hypothetical protein